MTRNTSWASVFPGLWLFTAKLVVNYIQMSFYRCSDFFHSIFSSLGLCCLFLIFQSSNRLTIDSPARMFLPAFLVRTKVGCLSLGLKCCFCLPFATPRLRTRWLGWWRSKERNKGEKRHKKVDEVGIVGVGGGWVGNLMRCWQEICLTASSWNFSNLFFFNFLNFSSAF